MFFNSIGKINKSITLFINDFNIRGSNLHLSWIQSFAKGLDKLGLHYTFRNLSDGYVETDIIVMCGFKKPSPVGVCRSEIFDLHNDKNTSIILESPLLLPSTEDRENWISVGLGDIDGLAEYNNSNSLSDRWKKLNIIMNKYYCKCCNYNAKVKSSYDKHIKTKKHKNVSKCYPSCIQMLPSVTPMLPLEKNTEIKCNYCNKAFKYRSGLSRHVKYTCKKNKSINYILFLLYKL